MAEHAAQKLPTSSSDRHKAYPNYDLPYRGLPAEIRTMIWREYLTQKSEVSGPYLELIPHHSDTDPYTSKVFCHLSPRLDLELFRVSKAVNEEATSVCKGTLKLVVNDSADRLCWFISLLSEQFRSRIRELETTFHIDCCTANFEVEDWLEPIDLLQLDVLTLRFRMRHHNCAPSRGNSTALDNYLAALDKYWSEDAIGYAIASLSHGRVMQIRFNFQYAPRELESHLNTVAKCLKLLRIDHEIDEGTLDRREFEISPWSSAREVVLTRTQVGLAQMNAGIDEEHSEGI